jgi:DNA-binding response OmpR family regulator
MSKKHILIIEDDVRIAEGLRDVLIYNGFSTELAASGEEGLGIAKNARPDLLLLDLSLPGIDGIETCRALRALYRDLPIIMLTARNAADDIVCGLSEGADDYVTKPFSVRELVLRVQAVLRRLGEFHELNPQPFILADRWRIDPRQLNASAIDNSSPELPLTKREVEILAYLHRNNERPVTRAELLTNVWGYRKNSILETRTVDIHIAKLRKKLELNPKVPELLRTIRHYGYQLAAANA